ncbi:MAG: zinc ribbon domain-containing protein [Gammaproteobacteria bacterium]|nr:zinc ribbon domain-containing protein [Gammaproteobacteria bacterium]
MPIYEYECQHCGYRHEALQKISEDPLTVCPSCNESALKKLVSAAGFRLSGSGWYETDFKSDNKKNLAKSDSDSSSSSSSAKSSDKSSSKSSKSASNASSNSSS